MRWRFVLLGCLATLLAVPAAGHAATITQPAGGAVLGMQPTISWAEGANEVQPNVLAASTPDYNADPTAIFCNIADEADRTTSCTIGYPIKAGGYYAWVQTADADTGQFYYSPFVHFTVRPMIGFADTGPWGKDPPLQVRYVPRPAGNSFGIKVPFSFADTQGWLNDPGAKVSLNYTVKRGRKVVKTAHHSQRAGGDEDWSFGDYFFLRHLRGIANRTRLHLTVVATGDGVSARRTATIKNPPARG